MADDDDDDASLDLRDEPPDPVPRRYARLLIQLSGGPNSAARATRISIRNIQRFIDGEKEMPWAVAKLLWLMFVHKH